MSFRRKLLLLFALTVSFSVAAIAWIVSDFSRRIFERANEERSMALVAQFQREFNRRGQDVVRRVEAIAVSETTTRMALALSRAASDYAPYFSDAQAQATGQQLDFLEFVDGQDAIISSAQWPAKFGYTEKSFSFASHAAAQDAFLKREDLPDGAVLGLFAARSVRVGDRLLYVIGGRRLDQSFLATLDLPAGMRVILYQNLGTAFSTQFLSDAAGNLRQAEKLAPIVQRVQRVPQETSEIVHWSGNPADDETVHAIPLKGSEGQLLGVLLVGNSRRDYVALKARLR